MKAIEDMRYFGPQEELVDILVNKTQNSNRQFFRILVAYYFAKMASMMRAKIDAKGIGLLDVNFYGINLASSGSGKGFSTSIMEDRILHNFKKKFLNETFPALANQNIELIALLRAPRYGVTTDEMREKLENEFNQLGTLAFSFDSGTAPAIKQMRHKLLMANAGSINMEIDEIGSNLVNNAEVLATFLELFDGKVKQKLIKNTSEQVRNEEIDGRTPTNMMLYGTPTKLLNGGRTEDEFYSFVDIGYGRRCFFGYEKSIQKMYELSPEQVYDMLTDTTSDANMVRIADDFECLADLTMFDLKIGIDKPIMLQLLQYKIDCERASQNLREFEDMQKAELCNRYYKTLKLAGAYAFIEGNPTISEANLHAAIKMAEASGESFQQILTRPRIPERIARYLSDVRKEVTQVDLLEDLPFYRGSANQRKDIMNQAIAWGYRNNIVIRTSYADNIEFFKGESMDETDLNSLTVSYSDDITTNYLSEFAPWDKLHKLTSAKGYHYTAHHFKDGYRSSDKAIEGFNLLILDVDSGTSLTTAQNLLKGYKALFATTKRHTDDEHRFRIILPLTHTVKLSPTAYPKFMENVFAWLPFEVDKATKDIARKWEGHDGDHIYQEGNLIDALLFIPDTHKQVEHTQKILDHSSLSNLERWFLLNSDIGSRSNTLIKYAYILVDSGYSLDSIKSAVYSFNSKLKKPLSEDEIDRTIMITTMRQVTIRDNQK